MREIKFKAKLKAYQKLVPVVELYWRDRRLISIEYIGEDDIRWWTIIDNVEALLQYIGLQDKNGKEIYEGDIVSLISNAQLKVVEWVEKYAGWNLRPNRKNAKGYEIIGNIFKNPEPEDAL